MSGNHPHPQLPQNLTLCPSPARRGEAETVVNTRDRGRLLP